MDRLGRGIGAIRLVAQTAPPVSPSTRVYEKLTLDLHMECKKFVMYRAHRIRDRQWASVHRIRALVMLIEGIRAFI